MQETKTPRDPKKSLWASYAIIFVVVLLFNALLLPSFARMGVQQVDYGTFLQMLEGGELTTVQLDDTEILFSDTENRLYSTNAIAQDLDIVNRLEAAGVKFDKVVDTPGLFDYLFNILIMFLPMILFDLGQPHDAQAHGGRRAQRDAVRRRQVRRETVCG